VSSKLLKLFFLEVLLGGAGAVAGSMLGNAFGRGGLFAGAVIGGAVMVTIAGYLACRADCIHRGERLWVIAGGLAGFGAACLVTLATLSTPAGPLASSVLIGIGAVLGAMLGRSPHGQP
jgi:uncharacterized membrane protein YeaQ/YmgE (transglycosylase-associated protein family)